MAQADADLARVHADVATDSARAAAARARINALLARDPRAPLGEPVEDDARVPAWTIDVMLEKARASRPGVLGARALREASAHELRAADREATWPSFTLGALYFAPVGPTPTHGYGVNASMTLPWLWGGASARKGAEERRVEAAKSEIDAARLDVDVEVATAEATTKSAAMRLAILRDRALPASKRAFDAAWTGYESARTDLLTALTAERSLVDTEERIVAARAALDHALTDLDAAVGVPVPRAPLPALGEKDAQKDGGDHAH